MMRGAATTCQPADPILHSSNRSAASSSNPGMAQSSPPPPAALLEELIEEILLRFPPDESASLFRASLVCKPWRRLISGPRFRRRYREFHRTPPILGFLCGMYTSASVRVSRFLATSPCPALADRSCRLVDARHGRVLLLRRSGEPGREDVLLVWDPITDEEREVPLPKLTLPASTWTAAVVCAAAAGGTCGHLDCHRGAFLVVYVVSSSAQTSIWTYSSDAGSWSDPVSIQHHKAYVDFYSPSVLVGNALCIEVRGMMKVLKYDLEVPELSVVGRPSSFQKCVGVFRSTDDGCLGFATVHKSKLYMWSRKHSPQADALWTHDRVIELETLLSSNAILGDPVLCGFVDPIGVILLRADNALFTVDLKTSKVKKVCDRARSIVNVVPYLSFCTPALGVASTALQVRDQVPVVLELISSDVGPTAHTKLDLLPDRGSPTQLEVGGPLSHCAYIREGGGHGHSSRGSLP